MRQLRTTTCPAVSKVHNMSRPAERTGVSGLSGVGFDASRLLSPAARPHPTPDDAPSEYPTCACTGVSCVSASAFVRMRMCVYMCMCICAHVYVHARVHVHVHLCACVCACACAYACASVRMCARASAGLTTHFRVQCKTVGDAQIKHSLNKAMNDTCWTCARQARRRTKRRVARTMRRC